MEYAVGLFFGVAKEICRRYLVIFIIGAVVLSLIIGGISVFAGGAFWLAAGTALGGCVAVGVIASLFTIFSAIFRF